MQLGGVFRILKKLVHKKLRPETSNLLRDFLIKKRVHFSPERLKYR